MLASVQALGHKKGNIIYAKWRREKLSKIIEIDDLLEEKKLNVFERLIKRNRPRTLFDSLINRRKRK